MDDAAEADAAPDGGERRPRAAVLFSGPCEAEVHLVGELRRAGFDVDAVDTKLGGAAHDLSREEVAGMWLRRIRAGAYSYVHFGTPCSTFSVRHEPVLRWRWDPEGHEAPAEWQAYVQKHNRLVAFTAAAIRAAESSGTMWTLENPADRARPGPAYWAAKADRASLFMVECIRTALEEAHAEQQLIAHCAFGSDVQKWTIIAHSSSLTPFMTEAMRDRGCTHGYRVHQSQAHGYDEEGRSRSEQAAVYPAELCVVWAAAIAAAEQARAFMSATPAQIAASPDAPPQPAPVHMEDDGGQWADSTMDVTQSALQLAAAGGAARRLIRGGSVADGFDQSRHVSELCEGARLRPPPFISTRNRQALDADAVCTAAYPPGLRLPAPRSRPRRRTARRRGSLRRSQAGRAEPSVASVETAAASASTRPEGHIAIADLFLPGVYEEKVGGFFREADAASAAAAALQRGGQASVPRVETVTITQEEMQPWARGIVWDCARPTACVPVAASDRTTEFPGKRQLNRAFVREAAELLGWDSVDPDIVAQLGEGGVETRSECELLTVLTFHHRGLFDELPSATSAVEKLLEQGWASEGERHLPYVPCRLQPRNITMQERARIVPGEFLPDGRPRSEVYEKPRITTDSSFGGEDSVNGGVPQSERALSLPTVQWLARALAICDTFGDGDGVRAVPYCVDAESAYSFCPVQLADLWTQGFCWWDSEGRARIHVDRRMGFGGAFAPNRFERLSTMVGAYIQHLQRRFDEQQPPPLCAQRRATARAAAQLVGDLPEGEAQIVARFLQVYVDDWTGCALSDAVTPPPEVAHIVLTAAATEAAGGVFAPAGTRVHVHAQLAVLGLQRFGLVAAPEKVVVGDPIVALGFQVGREQGDLRLPDVKRSSMLAALDAMRARAEAEPPTVPRREARRLVGRLGNVAQVFPELRSHMHGGHTVTSAPQQGPVVQMRSGSAAHAEWVELLEAATELVQRNVGVPLAPRLDFPSYREPGGTLCITDASGDDGVGGYCFDSARPDTIWLVSARWPAEILAAREEADRRRSERTPGAPAVSMPACELFGAWAVPEAVRRAGGLPGARHITAVGDCSPVASAINGGSSGNRQMRHLLGFARELSRQWLAVDVPREANIDADRLSHPDMLAEVARDARAAGLVVHTIDELPADMWAALVEVADLPMGSMDPRIRSGSRGRQRGSSSSSSGR